jgi:hydroxypyruvate reductase
MTVAFDEAVLIPDPERRRHVLDWLGAPLEAVAPDRLTAEALSGHEHGPAVVIAIGKAAPAMTRGAASVLDLIDGICVSDHPEDVPDPVRLLVGDHPVPGPSSYAAGAALLSLVGRLPASSHVVALVSGGGSALCESPRAGVSADFLSLVSAHLLSSGIGIEDMNLVRSHLSTLKGGGLASEAGRPIHTLVLSDVGAAGPEVVASGPTIPGRHDPDAALAVLRSLSMEVPDQVDRAMRTRFSIPLQPPPRVLADGHDAARALAAAVPGSVRVAPGWLHGGLATCLESFLAAPGPGVTVGAGEVTLEVAGEGAGGRDTHAALLAARHLGPDDLFCAFATDGIDGRSGASGAIVDGSTIIRGGDPGPALRSYDSAAYLTTTSDLLRCPPTGTNVGDLWILWRR